MNGHVFVVRGLLEAVAADALIVPTDGTFTPRQAWWTALGITRSTTPKSNGSARIRPFPDSPRPTWLLDVAADEHRSVAGLVAGLNETLLQIALDRPQLADGRVRPLVALPTLGVGLGGYQGVRGEVIEALHHATEEFVASSDFDVVFVVQNAADYAAFQSIRREKSVDDTPEACRVLAEAIQTGDVAFLMGAGVSISAGLPTWDALLETLRHDALPDLNRGDFTKLGVLDQAQLLSKSSNGKSLGERAAEATGMGSKKIPTLAHCLLASLGVAKAVTTNYDTLYEDAYKSAHGQHSIAVLPREEAAADRSWLLKMHGDVEVPDSIVLSRRDFVRYDAARRPLGSIVQFLMATGHLVVIGASMTDDNVLRLAHEVLAMNESNGHTRVLGTVVTLQDDPVRTALWEGDFNYIAASSSSDTRVAARDLEILLDVVAMHVSDRSPYVLDPRYAELLDDDERRIAEQLRDVARQLGAMTASKEDRWKSLKNVLGDMGAPNPHRQ